MSAGLFSHENGAPAPEIPAQAPDAPERDPEHEAAVPAVAGAGEGSTHSTPAPMAAGTFAVYPDGGGGFALVLGMAGEPEPVVHRIPAAMVKMAQRAAGLNMGALAGLLGGR